MNEHVEAYIVEHCVSGEEPFPGFVTFDEIFAVEEVLRLNSGRDPARPCWFRVTPCPFREKG